MGHFTAMCTFNIVLCLLPYNLLLGYFKNQCYFKNQGTMVLSIFPRFGD